MSSQQLNWKWLAGFVDGEGSICVRPLNYGYNAHGVTIGIAQTPPNDWILIEIGKFLERNGVSCYVPKTGVKGHGGLQISEFDSVEHVLKKLRPHLLVKRERADRCLKYMKQVRAAKERYGRLNWSKYVIPPPRLRPHLEVA